MMSRILASLVVCAVLSPFTLAQATGDRIDLYFTDWHSSTPRTTLGSLQERDIFTQGDPQNPAKRVPFSNFSILTLTPRWRRKLPPRRLVLRDSRKSTSSSPATVPRPPRDRPLISTGTLRS